MPCTTVSDALSGSSVLAGPTHEGIPYQVGCREQSAMLAAPAEAVWVPVARHFASNVLTGWRLTDDERDCVELIVSELAGNAAVHGRCDMVVTLKLRGDLLHIRVADFGERSSLQDSVAERDMDECGRGLGLVDALADGTSISMDGGGHAISAYVCVDTEHQHGR